MGKSEGEVAEKLMNQQKRRGHPDKPPSLTFVSPAVGGGGTLVTSDAAKGYEAALIEVYGVVPKYGGRGRPPTKKQARSGWEYLQIVKHRRGGHLVRVTTKVVFGDPETVYRKRMCQ